MILALLALSAGCASQRPQSGYLLGNAGRPVKNSQGVCVQIGPLTSADKRSECYQLAQSGLQQHVEPLPLDEFGYLFPPLKPESRPAPAVLPEPVAIAAAPAEPIPAAQPVATAETPIPVPVSAPLVTPTPVIAAATPPPARVASTGAPRYIKKIVRFSTQMPFRLNRAYLSHENRLALTAFVNSLERYRGVVSIRITGHTDKSGPVRFNKRLSVMRAKSAQQWLLSLGVDPRTVRLRGVGSSEPRRHAHSAADDRYVDIEVVVRAPAE